MDDETTAKPSGPETTAQTNPTTNSGASDSNQSGDTGQSLVGKIGDALAHVAERHGLQFRRGRGRPRKDGSPNAADRLVNPITGESIPAASDPALAATVPRPASEGDFLLHRAIIGTFQSVIKGVARYCRILAAEAGMKPEWVERNMATAEPDAEALADWSKSASLVMEKYGVRSEYSPEISLAVNTARLLAPYGVIIVELRAEIARRKAVEANNRANEN